MLMFWNVITLECDYFSNLEVSRVFFGRCSFQNPITNNFWSSVADFSDILNYFIKLKSSGIYMEKNLDSARVIPRLAF